MVGMVVVVVSVVYMGMAACTRTNTDAFRYAIYDNEGVSGSELLADKRTDPSCPCCAPSFTL